MGRPLELVLTYIAISSLHLCPSFKDTLQIATSLSNQISAFFFDLLTTQGDWKASIGMPGSKLARSLPQTKRKAEEGKANGEPETKDSRKDTKAT